MPKTIRVVATLIAKEGQSEQLKEILHSLIEPTRAEAGNLQYDLLQHLEDENEFRFVEKWTSEEALNAHFETDHLQAALLRLPEIMAGSPDIRRYRLVTD